MPWKEVSAMSQRLEFVMLAAAAEDNIRHLCRCYDISPTTAYKWLRRFQSDGADGLSDRSRRPHHSPSRCAPEIETAVIELRHLLFAAIDPVLLHAADGLARARDRNGFATIDPIFDFFGWRVRESRTRMSRSSIFG